MDRQATMTMNHPVDQIRDGLAVQDARESRTEHFHRFDLHRSAVRAHLLDANRIMAPNEPGDVVGAYLLHVGHDSLVGPIPPRNTEQCGPDVILKSPPEKRGRGAAHN
jgi:hypothetical protein